jgi:hypothetical protein
VMVGPGGMIVRFTRWHMRQYFQRQKDITIEQVA